MKASPYLEKDEKELLKERVILGKSESLLILTNFKVIFLKNQKEIVNSIPYNEITKIQNSKPSSQDSGPNTVSKIRIIDQKGTKTDFSFKGVESANKSKKVTSLINKQRKSSESSNQSQKGISESQETHQNIDKKAKKDVDKKFMSENVLKYSFLDQNSAAKKMYKDLVVEEQILTEDEFWNNFKSEIAEQKALYQKNGYIFEENILLTEPNNNEHSDNDSINQNDKETDYSQISNTKIEVSLPDFNSIKIEQENVPNSDEFKPSISIQDESMPILPDEECYSNFHKDEDKNLKIEEEDDDDEIERQNYIWCREVVQPLFVDPDEFKAEAEIFSSKLQFFSESFTNLPEIVIPPIKDAKHIINEISNVNYKRFNYQNITNPEIIAGLEILRKHKMEQQILLVHFWQNYEKNIKSHNNYEKTLRLRNKIEELKKILKDEKECIINKEVRKALIPLYDEIENSIYIALNVQLQQ